MKERYAKQIRLIDAAAKTKLCKTVAQYITKLGKGMAAEMCAEHIVALETFVQHRFEDRDTILATNHSGFETGLRLAFGIPARARIDKRGLVQEAIRKFADDVHLCTLFREYNGDPSIFHRAQTWVHIFCGCCILAL